VLRLQAPEPAVWAPHQYVRNSAVPDRQLATETINVHQAGRQKLSDRENAAQLAIDLADHLADGIALGGHGVEDLGHRDCPDRRA